MSDARFPYQNKSDCFKNDISDCIHPNKRIVLSAAMLLPPIKHPPNLKFWKSGGVLFRINLKIITFATDYSWATGDGVIDIFIHSNGQMTPTQKILPRLRLNGVRGVLATKQRKGSMQEPELI